MKALFIFASLIIVSSLPTYAQVKDFFSIHADYLHSASSVIRTSSVLIRIPDINPKSGIKVGFAYEHQFSPLLTSQLSLSYQQKGYVSQIAYSDSGSANTYHYLSVLPSIGIVPLKNLRFFFGPEMNFLLSSSQSQFSQRFEFGLTGSCNYQMNRIGLNIGYFKGLTSYYVYYFYYFKNQNWHLGLTYRLKK